MFYNNEWKTTKFAVEEDFISIVESWSCYNNKKHNFAINLFLLTKQCGSSFEGKK
jgi:hypothetical protein